MMLIQFIKTAEDFLPMNFRIIPDKVDPKKPPANSIEPDKAVKVVEKLSLRLSLYRF